MPSYLRRVAIVPLATNIYPSPFKMQGCWLDSLTRITYFSKLIGICSFTAYLHLEVSRV